MTSMPQPVNNPIPSDLVEEDASFSDIVQEFVDSLPGRMETMEQAFSANDLEVLRRAAHQLKGSGGGHGYDILTKTAGRMEQDVLDNDLEAVRRDINELEDLASRVVVQLD